MKIPFSFYPERFLEKLSKIFLPIGKKIATKQKNLQLYFEQADISIKPDKYLALCYATTMLNFIIFTSLFIIIFKIVNANLLYGFLIAFILVFFMFLQQMNYPKLLIIRRIRNINVNLLPAIRALMIQLNAGITFFNAMKNIAKSNYGLISVEFQKAINSMESGVPAVEALEKISRNNPSIFFRRAIWQIITGMQVGADISIVLREIVNSLVQEQITEIQAYGGRLSPSTMFYMVFSIIFPALGITFVIVLSTFVRPLGENYKLIIFSILGFVVLFQIIFLGIIKSRRPPLI
ncbi:MAG: type II secretion system F family protein [Candidatus Pacearchaeota archaeon]|nr:type II secretion system F family protein [Candidatus Pacearchaeota archaeon]